jgi:hypothetical protein
MAVPEVERTKRCLLDAELCVIDKRYFFVRCCLDIPILGDGVFRWLVWVSLSEKSFQRTIDVWQTKGRELEPPYFGWLNTSIPNYPETLNLKMHIHTRPIGERPQAVIEPTEHPLSLEQRRSITLSRAQSLADSLLIEGGSADCGQI